MGDVRSKKMTIIIFLESLLRRLEKKTKKKNTHERFRFFLNFEQTYPPRVNLI